LRYRKSEKRRYRISPFNALLPVALIPKAMTNSSHWQVFWLAQLFSAFPFLKKQWHSGKKALILSLQLREQLRILTGFPFHPHLLNRYLGTNCAANL
jgi:hypothetical protein